MGNSKYTLNPTLKVLCNAWSETFFHQVSAMYICGSSLENCIAASPCSRKSFYAHMRVDDGLCAHAGGVDLFPGLPTIQCLFAFSHNNASN